MEHYSWLLEDCRLHSVINIKRFHSKTITCKHSLAKPDTVLQLCPFHYLSVLSSWFKTFIGILCSYWFSFLLAVQNWMESPISFAIESRGSEFGFLVLLRTVRCLPVWLLQQGSFSIRCAFYGRNFQNSFCSQKN